MAKKNLAALMSGIMGAPEETESSQIDRESTISPDVFSADTTPTVDAVKTEEKRGRGKPRKPIKCERTTLLIEPDVMRKIKYMSLMEGMTQTDIIDAALRHYITDWESHNGKIRFTRK